MNTPIAVSLTPAGADLADRLARLAGPLTTAHRPERFTRQLRDWFTAGHPLILITATGIAVRSLAPVIGDKHRDPPVLVIDQHGQYVIPLLGGHEAGGNEWGRRIATALGAQLVLTTAAAYTHPVWVAGLGCERDCPRDGITAILTEVLDAAGIARTALTALASIDLKADEAGLLTLAAELERPFITFDAAALQQHESALTERSEHVYAAVGCYGVAEAAALAGAARHSGASAELVITKHKGRRATAALARAYRETAA